eukprot:scaffold87480_cov45-Phaeocystis_antarctica.AAC.2
MSLINDRLAGTVDASCVRSSLKTPATSTARDADYLLDDNYLFGQNMTEYNPAPSPSGHPLLSGPPTLNEYSPNIQLHDLAGKARAVLGESAQTSAGRAPRHRHRDCSADELRAKGFARCPRIHVARRGCRHQRKQYQTRWRQRSACFRASGPTSEDVTERHRPTAREQGEPSARQPSLPSAVGRRGVGEPEGAAAGHHKAHQ